MNEEFINLSELFDNFYRRKISKGTLLRTLENYFSINPDIFIAYADSSYYACVDNKILGNSKKDIYKPEKYIKKNSQNIYLVRKNIITKNRSLECVVNLFIEKDNTLKIDTQIFEVKSNKVKSYWVSQMKNFEDHLQESQSVIVRKIDGMILDVKEERNEALILNTKPKILKRFSNLDMD